MSLKSRFFLSFFVMVVLNVVLGAMLIVTSRTLESRYISYERERKFLDILQSLSDSYEKKRRALDSYLVGIDSEKERFTTLESDDENVLKRLEALAIYPAEKVDFKNIVARMEQLKTISAQVFSLVGKNRRVEAIHVVEKEALSEMTQTQQILQDLMAQKKNQADHFLESGKRLTRRTVVYSLVMLLSMVLVGIVFSTLLYQSVAKPLTKLQEGAKRIGSGELELKLDIQGPPELRALSKNFEEMAESLKKLQIQIVQMDRMSAVGTLAGGVAHEINNPLTGVLGQAQLLLAKMAPEDPNRPNLEKIERAAQRCRKIVRGLLDFSRPQEYRFEPIDPQQVIEAALSLCEVDMTAKKIRIDWNRSQEPLLIRASNHHLQQVFLNMMTNAMHAMPNGGTLTIGIRKLAGYANQNLRVQAQNLLAETGDFMEITFSDTGMGIAPEHIKHLFDPFFTTKEPGKGTGLGLSISFGIIQQHSGSIEVTSPGVGLGATFKILIPSANLHP